MNARYKKNGKVCRSSSTQGGGLNYFILLVKKPKKPATSGKFNVSGKAPATTSYAGAKAQMKGRFTSSTRAKYVVSATWKGCKTGKIKIKKAVYRAGG